jgi:hypothetical protein
MGWGGEGRGGEGVHWIDLGKKKGQVAGSSEYGDESLGSINEGNMLNSYGTSSF